MSVKRACRPSAGFDGADSRDLEGSLQRLAIRRRAGGIQLHAAEEMTGDEHDQRHPSERSNGREPERKSNGGNNGTISDKQRSMLFARGKAANIPMNDLSKCWIQEGFEIAAQITKDKFDAVLKHIDEWKAA